MSVRFGFVLAAMMAMAAAHASYDLLLMADNNVDYANGKFAKIHRFDPISGTYLGSIGSYTSAINALAADRDKGICYVQSGGSLTSIDYSTGQVDTLNTYSALGMALASDGKTIFQYTSTLVRSVSTTTGNSITTLTPGFTIGGITVTNNGFVVLYDKTNGMIKTYNATTLAAVSSFALPAITTFGGMCIEGGTGRPVMTVVAAGYVQILRYNVSVGGALSLAPSAGYNVAYINNVGACAPQHDGIYAQGTHPVSGQRVYGFTSADGQTAFMPYSQVVTPGAMCTVLAPEPGTWAALGLGALILLRRRK